MVKTIIQPQTKVKKKMTLTEFSRITGFSVDHLSTAIIYGGFGITAARYLESITGIDINLWRSGPTDALRAAIDGITAQD